MGLCLVEAILESGGDVICIDLQPGPPAQKWSQYSAFIKVKIFIVRVNNFSSPSKPPFKYAHLNR